MNIKLKQLISCVSGTCSHRSWDSKCLYNKYMSKDDSGKSLEKAFEELIKAEIKDDKTRKVKKSV